MGRATRAGRARRGLAVAVLALAVVGAEPPPPTPVALAPGYAAPSEGAPPPASWAPRPCSALGVQVLPIDLPNALRLANAANPTVLLARARVEEAYARVQQARVAW